MTDDAKHSTGSKAAEANSLILGGLGIGALGVISAAIGGAVCPVCIVAAPALLGVGAYKRWKAAARAGGELELSRLETGAPLAHSTAPPMKRSS